MRQKLIGDERVGPDPADDGFGEQVKVDAGAALPGCPKIAIDHSDAIILSRHGGRIDVPSTKLIQQNCPSLVAASLEIALHRLARERPPGTPMAPGPSAISAPSTSGNLLIVIRLQVTTYYPAYHAEAQAPALEARSGRRH